MEVSKIKTAGQFILYLLALLLLMYFGRPFLVPFSFSLLIAFIAYPVCRWFEKKGFSRTLAITCCMLILVSGGLGFLYLMIVQFSGFLAEWPVLQGRITEGLRSLSEYVSNTFAIGAIEQKNWFWETIRNSSQKLFSLFPKMIYSSGVFLVMAIIIPVMSALLLYHRKRLVNALLLFFPEASRPAAQNVIHLSVQSYYEFIKGMLIVYLIVGMLNSTGLFLLGIPHAFLFGFAVSVMTFIPYVGIVISSLLPISIAWVQYNSIWYPLGVIAIFSVVQYLEANLIFPIAVSNRLKVNTLATIAAILTGAIVWGGAGMILFIPFLGIMKVISDHVPALKALSLMLGADEQKTKS